MSGQNSRPDKRGRLVVSQGSQLTSAGVPETQQPGSGASIRAFAPTGTSRNVIQSSRVVVPVLRAR